MRRTITLVTTGIVALSTVAVLAAERGALRGWVTAVDPGARTITVAGQTVSTGGRAVRGGPLEPGAFVKVDAGRIRVARQRPPLGDEVVRFAPAGPDHPGRVEFSHLRHVNALGEKRCTTCHSPRMGLLTSPAYASGVTDPALEPHRPESLGRFCATCHNGVTRLGQVGALLGRPDATVFTALRTGDAGSCARCHAPADHGADFTAAHGEIAEHGGARRCATCHAQAWSPADRQRHADLLAAERALAANPDDARAALVVGPHNFCVHCHRRDTEWR